MLQHVAKAGGDGFLSSQQLPRDLRLVANGAIRMRAGGRRLGIVVNRPQIIPNQFAFVAHRYDRLTASATHWSQQSLLAKAALGDVRRISVGRVHGDSLRVGGNDVLGAAFEHDQ